MTTYVNLSKPISETLVHEAKFLGLTKNGLINNLIATSLHKQSLILSIAKQLSPEDPQKIYNIMRLTNDPEKIVSAFPELADSPSLEAIYG